MLDPLSIPLPEPLRSHLIRVANDIGLPVLPFHIHEVLFALGFYAFIAQTVSPFISSRLFPKRYPRMSRHTQISWNVHVVSFVQSCVVNALSIYIILFDEERKAWQGEENWEKRIWGYTGISGLAQSLALGYFLWDLYMCARYMRVFGPGMLVHAICTCAMFIAGYRPFVYFYCPVFLLHELSSPFLNIHWFCDKLDLTGSVYQAVNGAFLTLTFFCCRLVWGTYYSVAVFKDVYRATTTGYTTPQCFQDKIALSLKSGNMSDSLSQTTSFMTVRYLPFWLGATYLTANVALSILNFAWFMKMIETIRKRFDPPFGTKGIGTGKLSRSQTELNQKKTT